MTRNIFFFDRWLFEKGLYLYTRKQKPDNRGYLKTLKSSWKIKEEKEFAPCAQKTEEYINEKLKKFLEKEGVKQTTVSHTPEQSEQDR